MARIFCTNDDGVDSPGLEVLARSLNRVVPGLVVGAPVHNSSGTGTAVHTLGTRGVRITPHTYGSAPEVEAYSVSATPALTVVLALREAFGPRPDVVVSGPNFGANVGVDIPHSGTVGAAMTAVKAGLHGLAVSLAVGLPWRSGKAAYGAQPYESIYGTKDTETVPAARSEPNWQTAADVAIALLEALLAARLDEPVLLNLNVPDVPTAQLAGIRVVEPARKSPVHFEGFDEAAEDGGVRVLTPRFGRTEHVADLVTDIGALLGGHATVTSLSLPGAVEPALEGIEDLLAGVRPLPH